MIAAPAPAAPRLLVVDDEPTQREMLEALLGRAGYAVTASGDGRAALERLDAEAFDVVLCDQRMPGIDGLELLARVRERFPDLPVVLMTAHGSVESAVLAMKRGAADYLTKPFAKEELLLVLERVRSRTRLVEEVRRLRERLRDRAGLAGLVGASPAMQEVFSLVERVAPADVSVLVLGESGTGKELVARAIHDLGPRRDGPFVALNCAALPDHLLESEFFGHEKGAFTGAVAARPGRFEQAHGGTLLLDEIGAMRVDLQAKLLRALQEREVQRLGGTRPIPVDVRIVAATSEDLAEAIQRRSFREDLYYRLNVVPITLPPLRDRAEDVPLLVRHFLERAAARFARPAPVVAPAAIDRLQAYVWPGNVRELQNVVERMVVLARGPRLDVDDLPPAIRDPRAAPGAALDERFALPREGIVLEELERSLVVQALQRARGALGPAARLLGITYKTLQYRIRKFGLDREDFARAE